MKMLLCWRFSMGESFFVKKILLGNEICKVLMRNVLYVNELNLCNLFFVLIVNNLYTLLYFVLIFTKFVQPC